ncbi:MAG: hypothetical protein ABFD54_11580 [Armatimonadota bacterium]|nr:hypothetical protein [bacterium]
MNQVITHILNLSRRVYARLSERQSFMLPDHSVARQEDSDAIKAVISSSEPCLVGRFGSTEMSAILCYVEMQAPGGLLPKSVRYVTGKTGPFWWDDDIRRNMNQCSGFFPIDDDSLERFGELMLNVAPNIDVLGSWLVSESRISSYLSDAIRINLRGIEPYTHENPWSEVLAGKKVLVVHPFEESIKKQYAKREYLFRDPRILPEFELKTLKAVQSIAGQPVLFNSWFDALDRMCEEASQIDFDVAIIGAGAYGLPLGSFIKTQLGKKALHLGGAVQILFGIKGKRWDDIPFFQQLYNEHWVRPLSSEVPENFQVVESGCYW